MPNAAPSRRFGAPSELRVVELSTAEQFLVGVFRCWDAFVQSAEPRRNIPLLGPVFVYMNMLGAWCAFEQLFNALQRHRFRAIEFQDVDCPTLGPDEARLMEGLAALQRGDVRAARNGLQSLLTTDGLSAVLPPLARIAGHLQARGHDLPARRDAAPKHAAGSVALRPPACA